MIEKTRTTQILEIAIHRRESAFEWSVYEIDTGSLLCQLTETPDQLTGREDGTIKLEVQRTHEWELVIGLVFAGSGTFLKAALSELGKRFGKWLADQIVIVGTQANAEVRAPQLTTVIVDPTDLAKAKEGIYKLLDQAVKTGARVELIVEPGKE